MLRIRNISNQYQKRTLRVLYGHTQATPYAATLDPSLRNTDGSFRLPLNGDTAGVTPSGAAAAAPLTRSANAHSLQNGLVPGLVLAKSAVGERVAVHNGAQTVAAFGLLANFVGGTLDELGDENNVGVWYGKDAVVQLLAPAFNDTNLATAYSNATAGVPVPLYAGTDGRLAEAGQVSGEAAEDVVAYLIERPDSAKITIRLNV